MNLKQNQSLKKLVLGGLGLIFLIVGLFFTLGLKDKIATFFSEASGTKAEIRVDAASNLGALPQPWRNYAQGGEEPGAMTRETAKIKPLQADYIRLDHLYDFHETV